MTVLLKNLKARMPGREDKAALAELVRLCESDEERATNSISQELLSRWQLPDFPLLNDSWVIVTRDGQLVGFACVWCEGSACVRLYLCVHPAYRCRGIGTLLLRMAEMRARQLAQWQPAGQSVILQALVGSVNRGAHRLLEREGYQPGRPFLRIARLFGEECEPQQSPNAARTVSVDLGLEPCDQPLAATALAGQDMVCRVHFYRVYEKELLLASRHTGATPATLQALGI